MKDYQRDVSTPVRQSNRCRRCRIRSVCLTTVVVACIAVTQAGAATQEPGLVYRMEGNDNVIYLLGSIHLLREEDHPLPATFESVYRDADALVMELDMDDLDPLETQQIMLSRGLSMHADNLKRIMGEDDYARARRMIDDLGLAVPFLDQAKPWFAALTIINLQFIRLGFDVEYGVESWFTIQAINDGKEIAGLESLEQQLAIFDGMDPGTQSRFLLLSLEEADQMAGDMSHLIDAWKKGDAKTLERELISDFESVPSVYRKLVVDRNRAWQKYVEELAVETDNYLVIVGALHLVGNDGLINMLREDGYHISRMLH